MVEHSKSREFEFKPVNTTTRGAYKLQEEQEVKTNDPSREEQTDEQPEFIVEIVADTLHDWMEAVGKWWATA